MTARSLLYFNLGELSSVRDLSIFKNATSFNISWTPPFSLDVTHEGLGPNMWYSVLIYNVTDETNPVEIYCTDCDNITQTYYIFTPDYFISCHTYQFSIIPINGAGQGETNSITFLNGMLSHMIFCYINKVYSFKKYIFPWKQLGLSLMDIALWNSTFL